MKEVTLVECGFNLEWKQGRWYYNGSLSTHRCPNFKNVEFFATIFKIFLFIVC